MCKLHCLFAWLLSNMASSSIPNAMVILYPRKFSNHEYLNPENSLSLQYTSVVYRMQWTLELIYLLIVCSNHLSKVLFVYFVTNPINKMVDTIEILHSCNIHHVLYLSFSDTTWLGAYSMNAEPQIINLALNSNYGLELQQI